MTSKVALVTGVSRKIGIGAAIARTFAEAGIAVFTTYYRPYDELMPWGSSPHEPEEIIEELRTKGVRAEGVEADLAVDPGPTDTGWLSDGLRAELIERAPFGRIGTPADVAQLVLFLASSKAQWITGQVVHSRGGL